jgi:hypothetical protein
MGEELSIRAYQRGFFVFSSVFLSALSVSALRHPSPPRPDPDFA